MAGENRERNRHTCGGTSGLAKIALTRAVAATSTDEGSGPDMGDVNEGGAGSGPDIGAVNAGGIKGSVDGAADMNKAFKCADACISKKVFLKKRGGGRPR